MKKAFLILSLIFSAYGCNTFYDFGHSPCTFHVNYLDLSCQNFNFSHCSWLECVDWVCSDGCSCVKRVTKTDASWPGCTHVCCDDSATYEKDAGAIKQCQDFLDWQFAKKMIIGFTVSFGGLLYVLFLMYCACCGPNDAFSECGNRIRVVCDILCCSCLNCSRNHGEDVAIQENPII